MGLSGRLWGYVDGSREKPSADTMIWGIDRETGEDVWRKVTKRELHDLMEAYREGEDRARWTLHLAMDYSVRTRVKYECNPNLSTTEEIKPQPTVREVWAALRRIFDSSDEVHLMVLESELECMKLGANETPIQLSQRLVRHVYRMEACGLEVRDTKVARQLVGWLREHKDIDVLKLVLARNRGYPSSSQVISALQMCEWSGMRVVHEKIQEVQRQADKRAVQQAGRQRGERQ